MRKYVLIGILALMAVSCGQYQKVLNSNDPKQMYSYASRLYEKGKYARAERLFALAEKAYVGNPQYERLKFMRAMSLFHMRQYFSAGYEFRQFHNLFPGSSKADEAYYYIVRCYQKMTPDYTRDLTYAYKTLEESERFFDLYPQSRYIPEVKKISKEALTKIQRKAFEHGKFYYNLDYYKSAIKTLNNFLTDYPGSPFREEAMYYRFMAAAQLALNSVESKKKERTDKAIGYYNELLGQYPKTKFLNKIKSYYAKLKKQS